VLTLWDLLKPIKDAVLGKPPPAPANPPVMEKPPERVAAPAKRRSKAKVEPPPFTPGRAHRRIRVRPAVPPPAPAREVAAGPAPRNMEERYDSVVRTMLARYDIRVRKWRSSMSGIAWYVTYRDGRVQRLIESPKPKGPMSAAIFLHEVGHHAIGFNVYRPRCLEEYHAWQFSLREMERHGLNITEGVQRRVKRSLQYAVAKAKRRGIREIPEELHAYLPRGR
jgi:hypothetical protein